MFLFIQRKALLVFLASAMVSAKGSGKMGKTGKLLKKGRSRNPSAGATCSDAIPLEVGAIAEGRFQNDPGAEGTWYSVIGTGQYMSVTTCVGSDDLDYNGVDTVITAYNGDCEALNWLAYDDDGGVCGSGKSRAFFPTTEGEIILVNVSPFSGSENVDPNNNMFGVTFGEFDEDDGVVCETATPLAIGEVLSIPASSVQTWFQTPGTDGYLAVQACLEEGSLGDVYIDVYAGACIEFNYVTNAYGYGSECGTAYFEATANETYRFSVYGYIYQVEGDDVTESDVDMPMMPTLSVTVFEVDELPNSVCQGATPMQLDQVAEDELTAPGETAWFTFVGTGGDLEITTCTGNVMLDATSFDSTINVFARGCNDLRMIATDDEGGKCGNGKSAFILSSVNGLEYRVQVQEYLGQTGQFGLKVSAK